MKKLQKKIQEHQEKIIKDANYKAKRLAHYIENSGKEKVEPGIYNVVETDGGGMIDYTQFQIEVIKETTMQELAFELFDKKGYMSPWPFLKIGKYFIEAIPEGTIVTFK
jgi:hypothetical protein